ncbi:hypothetical protein DFH08DRAFT_875528 [Mycena albidolilacea]|uniref:Uncharacterized protein n=1 Tax=Mycena albidolilacea TaxID=1033008 RepID=A0AAD6ZU27_9AGAR|nr:hypothetical protein DFH08DRAFT_875528 [Mycena albidolilacea]
MARRRYGGGCIRRPSLKSFLASLTLCALFVLPRYIELKRRPLFTIQLPSYLSYLRNVHPAAVVVWLENKALHGLVVVALLIMLFTLSTVVRDVSRRIAPPALTPTPGELEDGTADVSPIPPPYETGKNFIFVLVLAAFCTAYFYFSWGDGLPGAARENSVLENVGAFLLFLLRGLEILFVAALLGRVVAWRNSLTPVVGQDVVLEPDVDEESPDSAGEAVFDVAEEEAAGSQDEKEFHAHKEAEGS